MWNIHQTIRDCKIWRDCEIFHHTILPSALFTKPRISPNTDDSRHANLSPYLVTRCRDAGFRSQGQVRARQCRLDASGREQQVDPDHAESGRGGTTGARRGHQSKKRRIGWKQGDRQFRCEVARGQEAGHREYRRNQEGDHPGTDQGGPVRRVCADFRVGLQGTGTRGVAPVDRLRGDQRGRLGLRQRRRGSERGGLVGLLREERGAG